MKINSLKNFAPNSFDVEKEGLAFNKGRREILLLGIGNILLSDDGVGVYVVREIKKRFIFRPEIEIIDGGTKGLDLLPLFEERKRVLIVDAVDFGKNPGYISILHDEEIPRMLHSKLSVHHIGLGEVLLAADLLGSRPSEICLIGIQPWSLQIGITFSQEVSLRIEDLISAVINKLKNWGIEYVSCSSIKDSK